MKSVLFFFSNTVVGGAETNILKISRELTDAGYNIYWCYLANDGNLLESVDFELAGSLETGLFYKKPYAFYKCFKNLIQKNDINIVFNFGLRVEIVSRLLSKRLGIKTIISNIRSTDDWRKWYHTALDKLTQSSVDLWISNSIAGKEAFHHREKIPDGKIKVIYNFFEQPAVKPIIKDLSVLKKVNVGILANITREKGYFDLIELAKEIECEEVNYTFAYAGTDKLDGEFEKAVLANNLQDRFEFLGYITDKRLFFEQIDIFLLPSYLEGMPTVLLEAMSFNKPVVSTTVGGIPEVITDGYNGSVCSPGDIKAFAFAIKNIQTKHSVTFVENGRARLKEFTKSVIMKRWIELISRSK